ncbi:MAG: DUF3592 domain-containing protein [Actinomycetota bacterium]
MAISGLNWTPRPGRFLRWFSLFWIIAGAGFLVAGFMTKGVLGGAKPTFLTIGGIWVAVGIFLRVLGRGMTRGYQKREQLRATGIPGQARIVSMTQTGMLVNDQPQVELEMEVTAGGRPPYRVTRKEIVPLIALGRLSNGQALPVKIDRADPQNIAIEWEGPAPTTADPFGPGSPWATLGPSQAAMAGASGLAAGMTMPPGGGAHFTVENPGGGQVDLGDLSQHGDVEAFKAKMKATGQRGDATITEVTDTGMSVGENKLYVTSMLVSIPGRTPYTSRSPSLVAPKRIPQLVVGAKVPVWVDPANPNIMVADWDAAPGSTS